MSGVALGRLGTLSVKHLPSLPSLLPSLLPSPRPTVPASAVPLLFREPHVLSGYRPAGQPWRCYVLSLFQWHNESVNVWSHLLAGPLLLLRFWALDLGPTPGRGGPAASLDLSSLPLHLYLLSSLAYLCCSAAAHLLQSRSELAHYSLFFLDYAGVSVYQYGSALAHYFYCSPPPWRESAVGARWWYLPGAALLGWGSCAACCFAKARYRRPYPPRRKLCQLVPTGLAYLLDISPVAHRLVTRPWGEEPALRLHALQVTFFLLAAFFFCCRVPERLFPGRCDIVGQGHQIFHVLLSLCTLCQMEAIAADYNAGRRDTLLEVYGERQLWLACVSFPALMLCSGVTALLMRRRVERRLEKGRE